jgi:hypothetical protein
LPAVAGNFGGQCRLTHVTDSATSPSPDDSKAALARAFDSAWDRFTKLEGSNAASDDNRKRLAGRIVEMAKSGQFDEDMLSEAGLIHLCVLAEAARLGKRQTVEPDAPATPDAPDVPGARAFAPETVAAMSTALNLCLDELPLRIPSDALKLLSTSILDEAARGERDPGRLHDHALEALKSR